MLTMKSNVILPPPGEFLEADKYCRKRWRRVQHLANVFWERWKSEFTAHLQERKKWSSERRNSQVGDIVMLVDEALPRCQWKLARVVEAYPGSDGLVRRVKLMLGDPQLLSRGTGYNIIANFLKDQYKR